METKTAIGNTDITRPCIYIVPTPIGNLEDITFRAIRILQEADVIAAEDTRVTQHLLKHYAIPTPMISIHGHNEHKKVPQILQDVLDKKLILAVVSDAGTPGISDPGFLIIREAILKNIPITCLPGPTALIPALVMSGFPCDRFVYEGFLPAKKGRKKRIEQLKHEHRTIVLYESVHRIFQTLQDLSEELGKDCPAAICREISKKFEQVLRGTLEDLTSLNQHKIAEKGEFVIILTPQPKTS